MKIRNFRQFAGHRILLGFAASMFVVAIFFAGGVFAQKIDNIERGRTKDILKNIKSEIKKSYYDPTFHGIDLEARFKAAEAKIDEATSVGQLNGIIAQTLLDFNDSHLFYSPPQTTIKVSYGWIMQMIGDKCFVISVKPGSDAEAKGLKAGDEIVAIEGFRPVRKEMWKVQYYYNAISPRQGLRLIVQSPADKQARQLDVSSKISHLKRVLSLDNGFDVYDIIRDSEKGGEYHCFRKNNGIAIWKMPSFRLSPDNIDEIMMGEHIKGSNALILDLRGNPGGAIVSLERLAGYFFDKETKIADRKGRKEQKPMTAKPIGNNAFKGKLIVLIDSESASCSEIFARLVQLEKRGTVIGDLSAGAVMQSISHGQQVGGDSVILYGVSVTDADVIMTDGKSLEHIGVTPDELLIPTAADFAAGRDPVLTRAIELAGGKISPEEAGKLFPVEWNK